MLLKSLGTVGVLIAVAETRSLTIAGMRLGLSPSAVSKSLTRLEQEVGTRLVARSTRCVSLTDSGIRLYERFKRIAAEMEQIESDVTTTRSLYKGRLKVQLPIAFGRKVIVPSIGRFMETYPNLTVDVELDDRASDLSAERIDLAVRVGEVADTRLVVRKLCTLRYVVCAAPSYLAANPEPKTPEDLEKHRCLAYFWPHTGRYRDWRFSVRDKQVTMAPKGYLNFNNTESLLDAAVAGLGVIMVSTFVAAHAVRTGKLQVLLKQYTGPGTDVYAVSLPHMATTARVKAFLRFLQSVVPSDPLWDQIVK